MFFFLKGNHFSNTFSEEHSFCQTWHPEFPTTLLRTISPTLNLDLKYLKAKTFSHFNNTFFFLSQLSKTFGLFTLLKALAGRLLFCLHDKTVKHGKEKVFSEVQFVSFFPYGSSFFFFLFLTFRFFSR